jgi:hypothetical protein
MEDETKKLKLFMRSIPILNITLWLTGKRVNFIKSFEVKVEVSGQLHAMPVKEPLYPLNERLVGPQN